MDEDFNKVKKDLDFYKRAYQSQKRMSDKLPKGSFICIQIQGKDRKKWTVNTSIIIDDNDAVRKNNELLFVFNELNKSLHEDATLSYVEEGEVKHQVKG